MRRVLCCLLNIVTRDETNANHGADHVNERRLPGCCAGVYQTASIVILQREVNKNNAPRDSILFGCMGSWAVRTV